LTVSQTGRLEIRRALGELYCLSGVSRTSIAKFIAVLDNVEDVTMPLADDDVVAGTCGGFPKSSACRGVIRG